MSNLLCREDGGEKSSHVTAGLQYSAAIAEVQLNTFGAIEYAVRVPLPT